MNFSTFGGVAIICHSVKRSGEKVCETLGLWQFFRRSWLQFLSWCPEHHPHQWIWRETWGDPVMLLNSQAYCQKFAFFIVRRDLADHRRLTIAVHRPEIFFNHRHDSVLPMEVPRKKWPLADGSLGSTSRPVGFHAFRSFWWTIDVNKDRKSCWKLGKSVTPVCKHLDLVYFVIPQKMEQQHLNMRDQFILFYVFGFLGGCYV